VSFLRVTNEHLTLSIRRRCTRNVAKTLLMAVVLTYFGFYLPYASIWELPSLYTFVALRMCLRSYLMNDLRALAVAGRALHDKFQVCNEEASLNVAIFLDKVSCSPM
jgi:hypothetical protein